MRESCTAAGDAPVYTVIFFCSSASNPCASPASAAMPCPRASASAGATARGDERAAVQQPDG
jgi:hypothetical protein